MNGAEILHDLNHFIRRFCVLPTPADYIAITLWAAHTHVVPYLTTTPRLAVLSPEPGSGKTRVLEVLDLLTPEPMFVFSASVAAIFRTLSDRQITLLFDEVDTVFGRRGKDDQNEDLRALLNVGYKSGATVPRCVGSDHDVQHFNVFGAAALAGLGDLPDTIMSRSIVIRMRRRSAAEKVEPFRQRVHAPYGYDIRDRLAAWAEIHGEAIGNAWPELPDGIVDRPAEVWEPLIALADAAGDEWPEWARLACTTICKASTDRGQSLGVRLLNDLRLVFGDARSVTTDDLIGRLTGDHPIGVDQDGDPAFMTDAPWSNLKGSPIDPRGLASYLRRFDVRPKKIKVDGVALQGYTREDLWDAWQRYAPSTPVEPELPEPPEPEVESSTGSAGSGSPKVGETGCFACDGEGCEWCAEVTP